MTWCSCKVHLRERLLQVLHVARLVAQQRVAVAPDGAQRADSVGRAKRPSQQPEAHQLLQPLAVQHVALAPRHRPDVARIDQMHLGSRQRPASRTERYPVDARRLHGHRGDAARAQPLHQAFKIGGEGGKLAHRLAVAVRRHGHEMAGRADVDAAGVGVSDAQRRRLGALSHRSGLRWRLGADGLWHDVLHEWIKGCAPHGIHVFECSVSLNGMAAAAHRATARLTNGEALPDHANVRAQGTSV